MGLHWKTFSLPGSTSGQYVTPPGMRKPCGYSKRNALAERLVIAKWDLVGSDSPIPDLEPSQSFQITDKNFE